MVLDLVSLLVILESVLAIILLYGTAIFFVKRVRDKKLFADILVLSISFILGSFFVFNVLNYILLRNITPGILLSSQFSVIIAIILIPLGLMAIGFLLKAAFRPMYETATALTYLITLLAGGSIGALFFTLDAISIQWISGLVFSYTDFLFLTAFLSVLLLSGIWFIYEFINAGRYLRQRVKESGKRSPDLVRFNLLAISALSLPLVLFLPLLPDLSFFPVLAQRMLSLVLAPIFAVTWVLGWTMPQFLRKRFS